VIQSDAIKWLITAIIGRNSLAIRSPSGRRRPQPTDQRRLPARPRCSALPEAAAAALGRFETEARGAFAPATERAWRADTAIWSAWCQENGFSALIDDPDQIVAFVDAMGTSRKPSTISRYLASIARFHRAAGVADPTGHELVRLAKRRHRRTVGVAQRQVAGITESVVAAMIATTPPSILGLRDIALLLTARDMLARRSELCALDVADLDLEAGTVMVRRSKTDQEGEGAILFLAPRTRVWLRRWLEAAGIAEGAVFRPLSRGGNPRGARLNDPDVSRSFKRLAARAGFDPNQFSGHSCRVGMAQDLTASGADLAGIMQAGRWKSTRMPARYAEKLAAGKNAVARWYERQGR